MKNKKMNNLQKDGHFLKKWYNLIKKRGYGGMVDAADLKNSILSFSKEI